MSYGESSAPAQTFNSLTCRAVERAAKRRKCRVRYAEPHQLFIDIDSDEALRKHEALFATFAAHEQCIRCVKNSPSGRSGRYHVIVTLTRPVRDEAERVTLQALLGSDSKRELLALLRLRAGCEPRAVSVLFEAL